MDQPLGRRRLLRTIGAGSVGGAASGVAGCLGDQLAEPVLVTESFESGLVGWDRRAHVGPEAAGGFDWRIEVSDDRAAEGDRSLAIFTEGDHDDGTAWVVRSVPVVRNTAYDVQGSVQAYAASESFNTVRHLLVSVGSTEPTEEADFPDPDTNSSGTPGLSAGGLREPLDRQAGWSRYEFSWATPPLETDELFLALGASVVWETDRTDYLDDVRVELVPRE